MTVRDYLCFAARIKGVDDPASAADQTMQRVGLAGMGGRMQAAKAMSAGAMPDLAGMGRGSTKTKSAKSGFKRRKRK